jgi:hypothetical protein
MQVEKGRGMNLRGKLFSNTTYFKCINCVAPAQYYTSIMKNWKRRESYHAIEPIPFSQKNLFSNGIVG